MFFHTFKINSNFKESIKTEILGLKKNWKKDLNSVKALSSGFFPDYLFFDILKKLIIEKLFHIRKIKYKPSVWWANYYDIGHYAEVHSHQPEDISSIILIETDKSNPLYFNFEPGILNVEDQEGLVLLFDSKIKHQVNVCKNERITLAIDFVKDV
jgi:hypothetical protein